MTKKQSHNWYGRRAPRPYVAFAATSSKQAERLYRAQNLIWIWIGVASIISTATYFARPNLGPSLVTSFELFDITRQMLFSIGGLAIIIGVWTIRRAIEVSGHIFFTTGAILNVIAALSVPNTTGGHIFGTITLLGIAASSGFRALFIVEWIGADTYAAHNENNLDAS